MRPTSCVTLGRLLLTPHKPHFPQQSARDVIVAPCSVKTDGRDTVAGMERGSREGIVVIYPVGSAGRSFPQ